LFFKVDGQQLTGETAGNVFGKSSSSTSSNSAISVRRVASVRNSRARTLSLASVRARALALAAFTPHSAGMDSRWANMASAAADDFAPHPGNPG